MPVVVVASCHLALIPVHCSGHFRAREVSAGGRPVCGREHAVPVVVLASYHLALIPVHDTAQDTPRQDSSPKAGDQCVAGSML